MPNLILYRLSGELPKEQDDIGGAGAEWFRGFNSCLSEIKQRLEKVEISVLDIQKVITSKHIYVNGSSDTDCFVTVPIIELSQAILTHLENLGKEIKC